MPGIDYREVRARIPMSRVLELLDYQPKTRRGQQLRGPCPIHGSSGSKSTIFAVHLGKHAYYCHYCKSGGDQLKLWQAIHKRPFYWSTLDLCRAAGVEIPWLQPPLLPVANHSPSAHPATAEPVTKTPLYWFPL